MSKPFYLTTTLPYVNADPHIGFALEIVQADILVRYRELIGDNVFFTTGTDEHGQKIYEASKKVGKTPQEYTDEYAAKFRSLVREHREEKALRDGPVDDCPGSMGPGDCSGGDAHPAGDFAGLAEMADHRHRLALLVRHHVRERHRDEVVVHLLVQRRPQLVRHARAAIGLVRAPEGGANMSEKHEILVLQR